MADRTSPPLPRCLAVAAAASAGAVAVVALALPSLRTGLLAPDRPDLALAGLGAALALVATAWLWIVTVAVAIGAAAGRTSALRGVPAPLRRAVLACCGVALAGGLAAPVEATPGVPHEERAAARHLAGPVAGLPFPDRAVAALPGGALLGHGHLSSRPAHHASVEVEHGDSLWSIAEADLGPAATDAEVDARWRAIYELNRAEIGPDPDLIRPAQRLRLA